ncbi:hypothetical protein [Sphingomonas sp. GB1N7]|uniref:hypothetical protein n=1 Tax=Parasphingomonas caseinilytica TaxID=3096158 RepID=UPI002FC60602
MNPFEMVVAIVVIVTIGSVLRAKYGVVKDKFGNETSFRQNDDAAIEAENRLLRDEVKAMKERLAVLERIATDNNDSGARLDREIDRLRDRS